MVVVGKHFTFLLIVVSWEIPTELLTFTFCPPSKDSHMTTQGLVNPGPP